MKKLCIIFLCCILCAFLCVPAFARGMMEDAKDAVSTAIEDGKDLITDLKETVDPDGDGKPEAEGDGVVDGDTVGTADDTQKTDDTTDRDTTDHDTTDHDTTDRDTTEKADETTGVIEGMELEKNGINPWAIVIAIVVVIAVLVLVFILIPKRR